MFNPKQLSQIVNNLFSPEEQQQIQELENKPFDEQIAGFSAIVEKNEKIPESQKQVFRAIANDDEIKTEMKELQEAASKGGLSGKMAVMKKAPALMMKIQKKAKGL